MKISPGRLSELLDYNPVTGLLFWKYRSDARPEWNTRFAGKRAFSYVGKRGYCTSTVDGHAAQTAHRVAWSIYYGSPPEGEIDHINGDKTDNRIQNLRLANSAQNSHNTKSHCDSTSKFKGVSYDSSRGKWVAEIMKNGKRWRLGRFDTEIEAAESYKAMALRLHQEFARLS